MLLPQWGVVGEHCCFILNFESASVLGGAFPHVLPENTQNMNCYIEWIRYNYNQVLLKLSECHKMFDKLANLTNLYVHISMAELQLKLNLWDD